MGIAGINLTSDGQARIINRQTVHGVTTVTKTDGSTLQAADVTLRYRNETITTNAAGTATVTPINLVAPPQTIIGTAAADLSMGGAGSDSHILDGGDDVVLDDLGDDGGVSRCHALGRFCRHLNESASD